MEQQTLTEPGGGTRITAIVFQLDQKIKTSFLFSVMAPASRKREQSEA